MKLLELYKHIETQISIAQYISCRWVDVRKSITSMLKKSPKHVWSEVGASHQGSTSAYSGMPGEPRYDNEYKNEQHEKAMKQPIDQDAIRKAGW